MRSSLNLDAYSDRELVHLVADLGDENGWVTVKAFAKKVGVPALHEQCVSARFAWMRRYGIMERTFTGGRLWRLTEAGRSMAQAEVAPATLSAIHALKDAELAWGAHTLMGRFQAARDEYATVTRRELQREIRRRGRN